METFKKKTLFLLCLLRLLNEESQRGILTFTLNYNTSHVSRESFILTT